MERRGDRRMIPRWRRRVPVEFEVFGTSVGVGLVAGALSVLVPFLVALVATLAALALAGWASMLRDRSVPSAALRRPDRLLALGLLGAGALVYGVPGTGVGGFRGLLLALALVPLWLAERRRTPAGAGGGP